MNQKYFLLKIAKLEKVYQNNAEFYAESENHWSKREKVADKEITYKKVWKSEELSISATVWQKFSANNFFLGVLSRIFSTCGRKNEKIKLFGVIEYI